jgi:hypothetical protein
MSATKVFISYSHDDENHSERVLQLSDRLRASGVDAELDQYQTRPPQGWPAWCEEQLRPEAAKFVLVICTSKFRQRVENRTEADEGRGVYWEGRILYSYLYDQKSNDRFIPVLLAGANEDDIPRPLKDSTYYRITEFELTDRGFESLYRELTSQPVVVKPELGEVVDLSGQPVGQTLGIHIALETRSVKSTFRSEPVARHVDISRITRYAPKKLIGREAETALLNKTLGQMTRGTRSRPRVLTFVALGGEGKTSLVTDWVVKLTGKRNSGCDSVFAWSFYSQGSREQVAVSSDLFLAEAIKFFAADDDDRKFADSAAGAAEKGQRLAGLVGRGRNLLILDGLEPLQFPDGEPHDGRLKDDGIYQLLSRLAMSPDGLGLCVVTTRFSIPDLQAWTGRSVHEETLLRLSREAGVALL